MSRQRQMNLLRLGIRSQSTSTRPPPPAEISAWIKEITSRSPELSTDHIDIQRATHLQRTLPTRLEINDKSSLGLQSAITNELLPKTHHLAYFQPQTLLSDLGEDGSSTEYNAPSPYLRRMWAGGSFRWSTNPDQGLRIGEPVTQLNSVLSAEYKNDMIFVNQQRDLYRGEVEGGDNWAVRELRTHVFRREVSGNEQVKARAKKEASTQSPKPTHTFTYTPTAPLLFRFSALTYNAHRIHYDRVWCQNVENHPDLVVHGPMTAVLLVELAENVGKDIGRSLVGFEYRATSPMYVDKEIHLGAVAHEVSRTEEGLKVDMRAEQEGRVGMKAVALYA